MTTPGAPDLVGPLVRGIQSDVQAMVSEIGAGFSRLAQSMLANLSEVKTEAQGVKAEAQVVNAELSGFVLDKPEDFKKVADGIRNASTTAFNSVKGVVTSATDGVRNYARSASEAAKAFDVKGVMTSATDGVRRFTTAVSTSTAVTKASAVAKKIAAVATAVWTAATTFLGAAIKFAMGPVGLIIIGITALIAIIVLAYKRNETFRNIVNAVFAAIKNAVVNALTVVRAIITAVWPYVSNVIRIAMTVIRTYVTTYFSIVRTVVTTVFNAVKAIITTAIRTVVNTIRGVGQVVGIVRNAFNQARSAVSTAITGVVDFVRRMPGRIVGALGNIGRTLYNTGRSLIEGFINGIRAMAGTVVSTIKNSIIDRIPGPIKDALGIFSPSRVMAGIGKNVGEGLVVGIDGTGDQVSAAMTRLVPVPRSATIRPAMAALSTTLAATVTGPLGRATPVAATAPVTVNVHPRAGQSEYEIGRVAAREVAWAAKR